MHGRQDVARHGGPGIGNQGRQRRARLGGPWIGKAGFVRRGKAPNGVSTQATQESAWRTPPGWQSKVRHGVSRQASLRMERLDLSWQENQAFQLDRHE